MDVSLLIILTGRASSFLQQKYSSASMKPQVNSVTALVLLTLTLAANAAESEPPAGQLEKLKAQATHAANQAVSAAKSKAEELTQQTKPTASEVADAVKADINAIGAWEYTMDLVPDGASATPEAMTEKLCARGQERWECISVIPRSNGLLFTFKRPKLSVSGAALKLGGR